MVGKIDWGREGGGEGVCRAAGRRPRVQECEGRTSWGPHFHARIVGGQPGMGLWPPWSWGPHFRWSPRSFARARLAMPVSPAHHGHFLGVFDARPRTQRRPVRTSRFDVSSVTRATQHQSLPKNDTSRRRANGARRQPSELSKFYKATSTSTDRFKLNSKSKSLYPNIELFLLGPITLLVIRSFDMNHSNYWAMKIVDYRIEIR